MEKRISRLWNSFLLTLLCLYWFGNALGIGTHSKTEFYNKYSKAGMDVTDWLFALFLLILFAFFTKFEKRIRYVLLGVLAAVIVLAVGNAGKEGIIEFGQTYYYGMIGKRPEMFAWSAWHERVQILLVTTGCYFVWLLMEKVLIIRSASAVALLIAAVWDLYAGTSFRHMTAVCIFMFVIMTVMEWVQKRWHKTRSGKKKCHMVWFMPFMLVYFVLMTLMPMSDKPFDWQFAKNIYQKFVNMYLYLEKMFETDSEPEELFSAGISDAGKLLGNISKEKEEVLYVKMEYKIPSNLYLIGSVYDSFDGKQWTVNNESNENDRVLDAMESLCASRLYDDVNISDYLLMTSIEIGFEYTLTDMVYTPLKTWIVEKTDKDKIEPDYLFQKVDNTIPYVIKNGNMFFEEEKGYGTRYQVYFAQMNLNHPKFDEFISSEFTYDEQTWKKMQKMYFADNSETRFSLEDLNKHRENIYKVYGKAPELSPKVQTYLEKITGEAETDIEKLRAIENALNDLEYTLLLGDYPKSIDSESEFLEYFLFENQKGYCSYFATAFVMLARAEGIPTRYVEGYCLPVNGAGKKTIYSGMAHGWPEAYIEGIGWIPFEPTPGYGGMRYTSWETQDDRWDEEDEERKEELIEETKEEPMEEPENVPDDSADVLTNDAAKEDTGIKPESEAFKTVLVAGIIIVVTTAGILITTILNKKKRDKRSIAEKISIAMRQNLQLLHYLGVSHKDNETLTELKGRIQADKLELVSLTPYEEILYGNKEVNEGILQIALEDRRKLLQLLKKQRWIVYLYCKNTMKV